MLQCNLLQCVYNVFQPDEEKADLFKKKELPSKNQDGVNLKALKRQSLLTEQLEKCPYLPQNPFQEYAKYDGNVSYHL